MRDSLHIHMSLIYLDPAIRWYDFPGLIPQTGRWTTQYHSASLRRENAIVARLCIYYSIARPVRGQCIGNKWHMTMSTRFQPFLEGTAGRLIRTQKQGGWRYGLRNHGPS